jgi:tetratricopeptide (TPR) repeat protein
VIKLSRRGVTLVVIGVGGYLAFAVLPEWLRFFCRGYVPRWLERAALDAFWQAIRALYLSVLAIVPLILALAAARLIRCRRRGQAAPWSARALLCSGTLLALALLCEVAARYALSRPPPLPRPATVVDGPQDSIDMVVVGESTAAGWPYQPAISVAQVVGWRLEQLLPGRRVQLDMQAVEPGTSLEQILPRLRRLRYRPDMVLVCAGHNEFQTRYGWPRRPWHYADTRSLATVVLERVSSFSKVVFFANQRIEQNRIDALPDEAYQRDLVDSPCCTTVEYAAVLSDYRKRLSALADWCDQFGAVFIMVVPPSNLGSFPPNRSYLASETPAAERDAFRRAFLAACAREEDAPADAESDFRQLLAEQPRFAELHFRLARLLERREAFDEAAEHYRRARDCDGMPLRCPSDFATAAGEVCRQHPQAIFVDGDEVFRQLSMHGIADDHLMHDAQHPNLRGYLGLAKEVLRKLAASRAFGLPEDADPDVDLAESIEHFGIERPQWEQACVRSAQFYEGVAGLRYAPDVLVQRSEDYRAAARRIAAGEPPEDVEILGLSRVTTGCRAIE